MAKHFQFHLENLQRGLLGQAGLVEAAIHKAIRALCEHDTALAREVMLGDPQIDQEENHIAEECLKILALYQPVAVDLRRILAAIMINTDLERMGDLAEEIAERAVELAQPPLMPTPQPLQRMTDLTTMLVRQSLDAFFNLNPLEALTVMRIDCEVDGCRAEILQATVATMRAAPQLLDAGLSLIAAVRRLERIADHAVNIAEDVIYLVEGEIVRHRPPAPAASNDERTAGPRDGPAPTAGRPGQPETMPR